MKAVGAQPQPTTTTLSLLTAPVPLPLPLASTIRSSFTLRLSAVQKQREFESSSRFVLRCFGNQELVTRGAQHARVTDHLSVCH